MGLVNVIIGWYKTGRDRPWIIGRRISLPSDIRTDCRRESIAIGIARPVDVDGSFRAEQRNPFR